MNEYYFTISNINIRLVLPDIYLSVKGAPTGVPMTETLTIRVCEPETSQKDIAVEWISYGSDGRYRFDNTGEVLCHLPYNNGVIPSSFKTLLGLLPVREVLAHKGSLFLHSSHVSLKTHGRRCGLIFSAASQTGKSTQARLWCEEHGCDRVGDDRTVITHTDAGFTASSYVADSKLCERRDIVEPVGAIIILGQGRENVITRLSAEGAFMRLTFLVFAFRDKETESEKNALLKDLCLSVPIYFYSCRPDRESVRTLFERLNDDGVI